MKCTEYRHTTLACNASTDPGNISVWSVALSPDGKLLVTSGDDSVIKIWKMNGRVPTASATLSVTGVGYVSFSPDSSMLAVGGDLGDLVVYDTTTWATRQVLDGLTGTIYGTAFSPDNKQVLAADSDMAMNIYTLDSPSTPRAFTLPLGAWSFGVAPTRTATSFWVGVGYNDGTADVVNLAMMPATGVVLTPDSSSTWGLVFSPDGVTLATGGTDGLTKFWSLPPAALPAPTPPNITTSSVNALQFSPDGRHLAIASGRTAATARLQIWQVSNRAMRATYTATYSPISVAWAPGGATLVAGEAACGVFVVCGD
jgi:WD40 repeat protein